MIGYVDAPITWSLVRGMARRAGVDVPRAVIDGWLTRADLAEIVERCATGACAKGCIDVLATSNGSVAQSPPSFCAIKAELEALAPDSSSA